MEGFSGSAPAAEQAVIAHQHQIFVANIPAKPLAFFVIIRDLGIVVIGDLLQNDVGMLRQAAAARISSLIRPHPRGYGYAARN